MPPLPCGTLPLEALETQEAPEIFFIPLEALTPPWRMQQGSSRAAADAAVANAIPTSPTQVQQGSSPTPLDSDAILGALSSPTPPTHLDSDAILGALPPPTPPTPLNSETIFGALPEGFVFTHYMGQFTPRY